MKTIFALGLLAISFTAHAAAEPAIATSAPASSQVTPHNHMQEKIGAPSSAGKTVPPTSPAMNEKTRHNHQRDTK